MGNELLPCPFCGGEAELKEYKPNVSGVAICKECGARSPICKNDHTRGWRPKAVESWNTRAERTCHFSLVVDQDPSRKHRGNIHECSVCGTRYAWGFIVDERLNYCPNCGAKVVD